MIPEIIVVLVVVVWVCRSFLRRLKVRHYGNKHVFITGCDTGFGNMLAKRLDSLGFRVHAGCLTEQGAKNLKLACSKHLTTYDIDVSKESSIGRTRQQVERKLPNGKGLWAIVNNAGIAGSIGLVECLSTSEFRRTIEINLLGVIFVTKEFLPLVRKERGRVINMSSICGRFGFSTGPYSASKYGVEGFSDQLRRELYHTGVSVHLIEPGYFRTGIVDEDSLRSGLLKTFSQGTQEVQDYYGTSYRDDMVEKQQKVLTAILSPKTYKVVDAYEHAVTSRFPKIRYVVGLDANILFRTLWNLPECVTDFLVSLRLPKPEGART